MGDSKRRTSSVVLLPLLLLLLHLCSAMFFLHCCAQTLPQDEVESLKMIASKLSITYWKVTETSCTDGSFNNFTTIAGKILNNVTCDCTFDTNKTCHVTNIQLKGLNLTGTLPTEFANLTQLTEIDLSRNYINGTLLTNLSRIPLKILGLIGNRISGTIPKEIAEITTLESLMLEDNQLGGPLDPSLGTLSNLTRLLLSANNFNGTIPESFGSLTKLTDFRIDGSPVTGKLPEFIGNWTNITRLDMQGTAMEGPIPSAISNLTKLTQLRITDLNGSTTSPFPDLKALTSLQQLILRNCLITGEIQYFGDITSLQMLDLSFNRLTGPVPDALQGLSGLNFMILTNNSLTGPVPNWAIDTKQNFDYSYNNFTGSSTATCQQSSVNFISSYSSSEINSVSQWCLKEDLPCSKKPQHHSLFINCGGEAVKIGENQYTEDTSNAGATTFIASTDERWAHSTTGQYMDNAKALYKATNQFSLDIDGSDAELYQTARLAPTSLKYFGLCMIPGSYTVKLHFAEIMYSNAQDFTSLGERIFDVSIQGELKLKDYNIAKKAGGVGKPIVETYNNVTVTGTTLEIHLYWSGKGTTAIPDRGVYGPLISAISITPNYKIPGGGGGLSTGAVAGIAVAVSCVVLLLLVLAILWYMGFLRGKDEEENELRHLDLQTGRFSLRQIKAATGNFAPENKIGEGGFGPVFKGVLADGTVMAVKQLSSKSKQGNREFLNEIGMISAVQHPNLVKLYGCCIEGNQLLLIYEYLENNSLARALFGREEQRLQLDWATRKRICIQIAKGLTYLHEESPLKIVHRDIKATNVLLDKDLTAKISDFGLAKLDEEENTHISTRIAGTIGYMAPEYAMRGYLTEKADIYSFGVVILEIVSGKSNTNYRPKEEFVYLLDWAYVLQEQGNLLELVDPSLGKKFSKHEAMRMLNLALLCTNPSPTLRPPMSSVVAMLEGKGPIQAPIVKRDPDNPEARFRAFEIISQDSGTNYSSTSPETELVHQRTGSMDGPWIDSTVSSHSKDESEGPSSEKGLLL